jgi:cyclophilin family peptidyl-prolyl cis-trans isomerase/HEAT repeat protein
MKAFVVALLLVAVLGAVTPEATRQILSAEHSRSLDGLAADLNDPALAARAALAIGRTKDPQGAPALRAELEAKDPAERAMVVYALGLLADHESLRAIESALSDPNGAVRYAAADALGRLAAAGQAIQDVGWRALLEAATRDADPNVRGHAAASLDAFGKRPNAEAIGAGLRGAFARERETPVRWHIMWTLSRAFVPVTPQSFFASALHDRDDLVRLEAARGLGRQKNPKAIALLKPLLNDPSWRVQEEANEALRRLQGQAPSAHLTKLQPGLHLPALPAAQPTAVPHSRPSDAAKLTAPPLSDVILEPPLNPTTAALMNGPMPGPHPRVKVDTSAGSFVLRLYPEWAPFTVASFLSLVKAGFYDGNRWFRIVPDFVVQTGDATNTGDGDAGYTIGAEENPVEQRAGIISMGLDYDDKTNTPKRDSAGSQFYITMSPQLHLNRDFTVFGEVESGFDVLPHLVESDTIVAATRIGDD